MSQYLTANQVASELRCSVGTIYKWVGLGLLQANREGLQGRPRKDGSVSGNLQIERSVLEAFKRKRGIFRSRVTAEDSTTVLRQKNEYEHRLDVAEGYSSQLRMSIR